MSLPLNMRFRFLGPNEMRGQPTIPINVPNNPANVMDFVVVPALLQIQLLDPENDMKPTWFDVPFAMPEAPPIIQIETRVQPKKRDWTPPRKN